MHNSYLPVASGGHGWRAAGPADGPAESPLARCAVPGTATFQVILGVPFARLRDGGSGEVPEMRTVQSSAGYLVAGLGLAVRGRSHRVTGRHGTGRAGNGVLSAEAFDRVGTARPLLLPGDRRYERFNSRNLHDTLVIPAAHACIKCWLACTNI
jgi:hypothetical protein